MVTFGGWRVRVERLQALLLAALLALTVAAWFITEARMGGMDMGPGTDPGSLGFYTGTWVVMMAAMMFPSIAPMVRTYALIQRRRARPRSRLPAPALIAAFVGGYLACWTAFGIAAYLAYRAIGALDLDVLAWSRGGPYAAGAVITAAAVYQLTPLKGACLSRCRGPLGFLMERWRDGLSGGFRLGIEHGTWCVGCCWALMASLFALGAMSIGWMAFIAVLIAVERLLPWKTIANRSVAILLLALGLAVALAPDSVPGLTVPGA